MDRSDDATLGYNFITGIIGKERRVFKRFPRSPILTRSRAKNIIRKTMSDKTETSNALEKRMETLEGNVNQIMDLLKALTVQSIPMGLPEGPSVNTTLPSMTQSEPYGQTSFNPTFTCPSSQAYPTLSHQATVLPTMPASPKSHGNVIPMDIGVAKGAMSYEQGRVLSKMESLEEKLRAIQGLEAVGSLNVENLCWFPDLVIPPKFKMPDFEKYKGKGDPKLHLNMYIGHMAPYLKEEKLMIHCFQHSLSGAALNWFLRMDKSGIRSWEDLAEAFVQQYRYNTEIVPDRFELQRMEKRSTESFREYAQRWRDRAAEVHPPLTEREMVATFIKTLKGAYLDKLISSLNARFSDLVFIGEGVEDAIREGKLYDDNSFKKPFWKNTKKEGEIGMVSHSHALSSIGVPSRHRYPFEPCYATNARIIQPGQNISMNTKDSTLPPAGMTSGNKIETASNERKGNRKDWVKLEPIPVPYVDVYNTLKLKGFAGQEPPEPVPNPPPKWYNPTEKCLYHMGAPGHSIERCLQFKFKVQKFIDAGLLSFEALPDPPTSDKAAEKGQASSSH